MGVLLGVIFGLGLLTAWLGFAAHTSASDQDPEPIGVGWDATAGQSRSLAANGSKHSTTRGLPWSGEVDGRWVAAAALGCGVLAMLLTGLIVAAVLAACAGLYLPSLVLKRREARTAQRRREAWPDVIDGLVSAVRAGMSLPEAVAAVAHRGPEIVRPDFQRFADDYRASGRFTESLTTLRRDLNDPVADRMIEALLAARDVGGSDLGRMLRTLADFVRQDLRLRGEAEARRSWTVNGARLAVAAPWIVLCLLSTRPDAAEAYRTSAGVVILVGCAAACALAYGLMVKIGRLPDEKRVML